jgi:hypothetical protein
MSVKIKLRRDTYQNWYDANPTLALGEPSYDTTNNKIKIGDGTTSWRSLSYLTDATGGGGGNGYTGSVGYTGSGATGYTGSGATGYTGSGATGYTGSGATGYTGSIGYSGSRGIADGYRYNFNTATTPVNTPANGDLKFNNSSAASVTNIYISNSNSSGTNLSSFISSWGNSNNPVKGYLVVCDYLTYSSAYLIYSITSVTSNTGYYTIGVSYISGTVMPTNAQSLILQHARAGDVGYTGSSSGGGNGYTGSIGGNGYTGSIGGNGYTGSIGDTGYTGSIGDTGYTGSGATGFTGSIGGTGYTGSSSSGGSGLTSRTTANVTTASLADQASGTYSITGFIGYGLYKIQTSAAAWVVVYDSTAARTADASRDQNTDPTPGSGVIAEAITTGSQTIKLSPGTIGFSDESPATDAIPIKVTNLSGGSITITVTLTLVCLEV